MSSLTTGDWIGLKATLHALDHREFICGECQTKYQGRPDKDVMTEKLRAQKGCYGVGELPIHKLSGGVSLSTCVGNFFDGSAIGVLKMHKSFEAGVMPFPGALTEQPSKVMEAFQVIDGYRAERDEREARKQALAQKGRRGR